MYWLVDVPFALFLRRPPHWFDTHQRETAKRHDPKSLDLGFSRSKDHRKCLTRLLMHLGFVRSLPDVWAFVLVRCRLD